MWLGLGDRDPARRQVCIVVALETGRSGVWAALLEDEPAVVRGDGGISPLLRHEQVVNRRCTRRSLGRDGEHACSRERKDAHEVLTAKLRGIALSAAYQVLLN